MFMLRLYHKIIYSLLCLYCQTPITILIRNQSAFLISLKIVGEAVFLCLFSKKASRHDVRTEYEMHLNVSIAFKVK